MCQGNPGHCQRLRSVELNCQQAKQIPVTARLDAVRFCSKSGQFYVIIASEQPEATVAAEPGPHLALIWPRFPKTNE